MRFGVCTSIDQAARLVEEVDHPNFRLLYDLYHVVQNGDRPEDAAVAGAHLAHIHMAKPDDRRTMYPGDGWDYGAFFRALRSVGYDGRISFEGAVITTESFPRFWPS